VVLNAGVGNSNTSMEYNRYLQDIRPLRPDWVILAYFVNDAEPDPPARLPFLLDHSVLFATLSTRLPLLLSPSYRDYRVYFTDLYAPGSAGFQGHQRALAEFGAALREDGVYGTLLLIPEMHQPGNLGWFADIYRDVAKRGLQSGFSEVIDPSADFPPGRGEAYWATPSDPHPNAEAHRIFAAALARSEGARRVRASLEKTSRAGSTSESSNGGVAAGETPPPSPVPD
jgi:hypothetical protein